MGDRMNLSLDEIIAKAPGSGGKGGGGKGGGGKGGGGKTSRVGGRATRRPAPYAAAAGRPRGAGAAAGGTAVYVGNLSWDVSWQDLKDHFKSAGQVLHADVMLEPGSTRSKGCGLVTFASAHDAANAIQTLHDTDLKGRLIFVREDREGGRGGGGRSAVSAPADTSGCKIFVRNISKDMTWMELKDMFKEAGTVVRADVAQAPDGTGKGFGTVLLGSTRDAAKAIQLFHETEFNGRILEVRPDAHA